MMRVYVEAACLSADPRLFEATYGELVLDALSYCERCPVTRECEDLVKPRRSYFDGVAAGKVWRDGRVIKQDALFDD
jgi:WhiB family transcriptional regulator, redox-sensing transcriptional regulator